MRHPKPCLLATLLLATAATACSESPGSSLEPGPPALATKIEEFNLSEPFSLTDLDNPCTPASEAIDLEGVIHGTLIIWDNQHFKSHFNVSLTGVDANGVKYQGTSTGNGKGDFPGSGTEDVVTSTVLNSQGGTPNFVAKIVLHFAANGTVQVEKGSEECRG